MNIPLQAYTDKKLKLFLAVSVLFHILTIFWFGNYMKLHTNPSDVDDVIMVDMAPLPVTGGGNAGRSVTEPASAEHAKPKPAARAVIQKTMTANVEQVEAREQLSEPVPTLPLLTAQDQSSVQQVAGQAEEVGVAAAKTGKSAGGYSVAGDGTAAAGPVGDVSFGGINGPSFNKQVQPVYPALAKRRGREGVVKLRLSITETGHLTSAELLEDPGFGFGAAALDAVRRSSFNPARHNGRPVAVKAVLPVRFALQ